MHLTDMLSKIKRYNPTLFYKNDIIKFEDKDTGFYVLLRNIHSGYPTRLELNINDYVLELYGNNNTFLFMMENPTKENSEITTTRGKWILKLIKRIIDQHLQIILKNKKEDLKNLESLLNPYKMDSI